MAVPRGIVGGVSTQIPSETPEEQSHHPPRVPSSSGKLTHPISGSLLLWEADLALESRAF